MVMVFNATFNNISVIWLRSVLLVEETAVLEKTTNLAQITDKLYHIILQLEIQLPYDHKISICYNQQCKISSLIV